jgi:hypothetical protein
MSMTNCVEHIICNSEVTNCIIQGADNFRLRKTEEIKKNTVNNDI